MFGLSVSFYQLLTFAILPMALTLSLLAGWVVPEFQAWGTLKQVYQQQVHYGLVFGEQQPKVKLCPASSNDGDSDTLAICVSGQRDALSAIQKHLPNGQKSSLTTMSTNTQSALLTSQIGLNR